MSNLYTQLAGVYDEIYQTLFDYDKEYAQYSNFLSERNVQSIVEIGCGTGHLAKRFITNGYNYMGLDLNQEMLNIAAQYTEGGDFRQADMRDFTLPKTYDAVLITGRTMSYLLTNADILSCFRAIKRCLKPDGVLIFDAIDAFPLFKSFANVANTTLETRFGQNEYKRISNCTINLTTGWTWDWTSTYFQKKAGEYVEIGNDFATLRSFTKDELTLFLAISGFKVLDIVDKEAYTWQDSFYVCKKVN